MKTRSNTRSKTRFDKDTGTDIGTDTNTGTGTGTDTSTNTSTTTTITTHQPNTNPSNDNIIFSVITGNLHETRRLVNVSNVNTVIDYKNNYTSLHHAVCVKSNNRVIEYLLSIGADPYVRNAQGKDSFDLSIGFGHRFLLDQYLNIVMEKLRDEQTINAMLNGQINNLEKSMLELEKVICQNNTLIASLYEQKSDYKESVEYLEQSNVDLKRKLDESDRAFETLIKKIRK